MKAIHVTQSSLPSFEDYCKEIQPLWESHWLTNMGQKHEVLEERLKQYLNAKNLVLFSNGHLALEAILRVHKLQGEVITTPFTFASTTHAIVRSGLTPVFCDIKPIDYTLDETQIEKHITERTCAIMPVHVYGNICNHKAIERIAQKHDLKVFYDAAHAFGETVDGINTANLGDASMFSFHATKVFHTIEGGAVCFKDESLKPLLNLEKNFGIPNADEVVYPGGNAKMNEFQAAMGLCNLPLVDEWISKRQILAERYVEHLHAEDVHLCVSPTNVKSNYSYFPVLFKSISRDAVFDHLKQKGIFARKYFYPLCNAFACYGNTSESTPVAKWASERILTLPLYPNLRLNDVDTICACVKDVLHKNIEY